MSELWAENAAGILHLPSGRLIRGRSMRRALPVGPLPTFSVFLRGRRPVDVAWESRWLRWPDFWLPREPTVAGVVLLEAWERAAQERVEVACGGGRGRTGTALACIAVLDGVPAARAVDFVRRHYDPHAVETPWQRRYVQQFGN
jgi:hypothetical protein